MLKASKAFQVVLIAITWSLIVISPALGADVSSLPPDSELKKWIVGSWKVDLHHSPTHSAYEIYSANGTFKHYNVVHEGARPSKLVLTVSGTWNVQSGVMTKRLTAANVSGITGQTFREKIESAAPGWFILKESDGSYTRQRTSIPAELNSSASQAPKIFSVKEAAQVLRYVVKPEYSYEARRMRASGTGLFELRFDYETGRLLAIDIVQSSGSRVLDHDAILGLKEWKAKPHSIRAMRIPITFKVR